MIYRVKFYSSNHKRFWSTVVRASTFENAVDVAWANITRPKWCVKSLPYVSAYDPRTDPAVRGFVREVVASNVATDHRSAQPQGSPKEL